MDLDKIRPRRIHKSEGGGRRWKKSWKKEKRNREAGANDDTTSEDVEEEAEEELVEINPSPDTMMDIEAERIRHNKMMKDKFDYDEEQEL